jgi:hypothetical protein
MNSNQSQAMREQSLRLLLIAAAIASSTPVTD